MTQLEDKKAGVIGWPIDHSLSPVIHGEWLARYGIAGSYDRIAVAPESLGSSVADLCEQGFCGFNVTLPHKQNVISFLDDVDDLATRIGAVNTVRFQDGRKTGTNTDAFGFMQNLRAGGVPKVTGKRAVVLGAGGAARAIIVALLDAGIGSLTLTNRTEERARSLAHEYLDTRIKVAPWGDRAATLEGADLLVNTTSLGMAGQLPIDLSLDALPANAVVNDLVYMPLKTPLLDEAQSRGNLVIDGLGMLLHQAVPGFEAWFGVRPEVDNALRGAVLRAAGQA